MTSHTSHTRHTRSGTGDATAAFVSWLVTGAVGPALIALPVNWAADKLADAAVRWFKRFRQTDDLSRLVKAAADTSVQLSRDEISNLRELLKQEQTWSLLADGKLTEKVQALTGQIADCLPPRDGRTAEDAREAAGAIARGLVEFAIFDLHPEIFQKVVLARLQQMTGQASALDEALFRMYKDLYHLVDEVKGLFKLVSDRLPPGPADLSEIKIYLKTLIDWLNTDPWPQDQRLGGPALTPAAIERKLRIGATDPAREQDADADGLARQCSRLVILGGPGSGKTWLAKRVARRSAEDALTALETGTALDEVELPLYTTCARLIMAPGDIREATASSAIERIGDLGGSRIVKALCLFFTERNARTLLVIDSLDEASDPGEARERLRQADSLRHPWRIVLTSRRSSWNNQLNIEEADQDHWVGELRPLQYPGDVESVIQRWFADRPEHGQALSVQIAGRPSLQRAATVPLILAFYCILGVGQSLPEFRHKLYEQVINRMLHAPWRSSSGEPPDPAACRAVLRTWAWQAAKNHPVSGVGQWEDDIPTRPAQLSIAGQVAVDHVAPPRGSRDFDTDMTSRRFVHRSIREHLVAEHVASLPADRAVRELLPHLWFDPDWEYTAPAAIAMHPGHDEVLWTLLCRASGSNEIPSDLAVIDAGGEVRKLVARVAAESKEDDWAPELARIISQARVDLAQLRITDELGEAVHWPTSNRQVRQILLRQLTGAMDDWVGAWLAGTLAQLDPTPADKRTAIEALLGLLADNGLGTEAGWLAYALVQLDPAPADKRQARQALLTQLTGNPYADALTSALLLLEPTREDEQRALGTLLGRPGRAGRSSQQSDRSDPSGELSGDQVRARRADAAQPHGRRHAPGPRHCRRIADQRSQRRTGGPTTGGYADPA